MYFIVRKDPLSEDMFLGGYKQNRYNVLVPRFAYRTVYFFATEEAAADAIVELYEDDPLCEYALCKLEDLPAFQHIMVD